MQWKRASEHPCWLHPSHSSHCLRKLTLFKEILEGLACESGQFDTSQPFPKSNTLGWTGHWADSATVCKYCKSNLIWADLVLCFPPKTTLESSDWQSACSVFIANSTLQFLADAGCSEFEGPAMRHGLYTYYPDNDRKPSPTLVSCYQGEYVKKRLSKTRTTSYSYYHPFCSHHPGNGDVSRTCHCMNVTRTFLDSC